MLTDHDPAKNKIIIWGQDYFQEVLSRERKRTKRSGKPVLLMTVDINNIYNGSSASRDAGRDIGFLSSVTRETDIMGWCENGSKVGVLFTEIGEVDVNVAKDKIIEKVTDGLRSISGIDHIEDSAISFSILQDAIGRKPARNVPINLKTLDKDSAGSDFFGTLSNILGAISRHRSFVLLCDILLVVLALVLGNLYFGLAQFSHLRGVSVWFRNLGGCWPSFVLYPVFLYMFGLYDVEKRFRTAWSLFLRILLPSVLIGLCLVLWSGINHDPQISRIAVVLHTGLAFILVTAFRLACGAFCHVAKGKVGTLIIGAGESGLAAFRLLNDCTSPYEVRGFIDDDSELQGKFIGSDTGSGNVGQAT